MIRYLAELSPDDRSMACDVMWASRLGQLVEPQYTWAIRGTKGVRRKMARVEKARRERLEADP